MRLLLFIFISFFTQVLLTRGADKDICSLEQSRLYKGPEHITNGYLMQHETVVLQGR